MLVRLPILKKRSRTAINLLRAGEYRRFRDVSVSLLKNKFEFVGRAPLESLSPNKAKVNAFNPMATRPKKALTYQHPKSKLTAACILDEFSSINWAEEFNLIHLTPENWANELTEASFDFLFVESAWRGKNGSWKGRLNQVDQVDETLEKILQFTKSKGIPTAFWNKEDPPFFDEFRSTAALFDFIFTTDENCVERYETLPGKRTVEVLPFAAQPRLHNPARNSPTTPGFARNRFHEGGIAFAGTYFASKFPDRKEQLDTLLCASKLAMQECDQRLTIFSRMGSSDQRYAFPKEYKNYVVGSLPYPKMLSAFQEHKVFLNVNTVTNSPSMCARRLFEIPASGTTVVSTPSQAIRTFFSADSIPVVHDLSDAKAQLLALLRSTNYRDKKLHKAQRCIWNNNTYAHRALKLTNTMGLTVESNAIPPKKVSVITATNRPHQVEHLLGQIGHQKNVEVEVILGLHGFQISDELLQELAVKSGLSLKQITLLSFPDHLSLGTVLNELIMHSRMPLITKMDDDDFYLPNYLEDQANALMFSGANLVGKQAVYVHLGSDEILLRNGHKEHIYTNFVAGPTLFGYRETFEQNPFEDRTNGEDTAFLKSVQDNGGIIYSSDRFNFIQERSGSHTWELSDTFFLENGEVETWGDGHSHVTA